MRWASAILVAGAASAPPRANAPSHPFPALAPKTKNNSFEWSDLDTSDPAQLDELYTLLHHNYVEDDSEAFRFDYKPPFLAWALRPPGWRPEWHIGVRAATGKKQLVGFISAIPSSMGVNGQRVEMVEINFLCVHKKLRAKRLAPLLIREVTRRVNLRGVWQAAYTAGVVLPVPLAEARYWHRPLATRKLVDIGFSSCPASTTLKAYEKEHRLPGPMVSGGGGKGGAAAGGAAGAGGGDATALLPGMRPFDPSRDADQVAALLGTYLRTGPGVVGAGGAGGAGGAAGTDALSSAEPARFRLAPIMTPDEVAHWLGPREGVVESWVIERRADDPAVLRLLRGEEEDEGEEEGEGEGDGEEEERARRRARRAAARRAVAAARDVALAQAEAAGGDLAKAAQVAREAVAVEAGAGAAAAVSSKKAGVGGGKKGGTTTTTPSSSGGSSPILFASDLLSFYTIPSSVLNHPTHRDLRAAYGFYTVPGTHTPKALLRDALCLAKKTHHDVFNALELSDSHDTAMLRALKFGAGDGTLRYYLYNWRARGAPFDSADVGLVLL